jgi:peptide/nickel transport system substrate-binding protein
MAPFFVHGPSASMAANPDRAKGGSVTTRHFKVLALAGILAIAAAACGSGGGGSGPSGSASSTPTVALHRGGTLNVSLSSDVSAAFDPQKEYYSVTWEFYRCCLLRTLLSYNGHSTEQGGTKLFPDLAASMPTVSPDGLTWTFKLKPGIHYGDPVGNEVVTSHDIVRALEREACSQCAAGGYSFYYSVIKGFDAYSAGKAKTISGLQTPDDNTLVVKLDQPAGDLPYRFSMPATAPIPPMPGNSGAKLGVATGHTKDYGRFLVATGPYEFQGANKMKFPGGNPAAGYQPGKAITLVRNPHWDRSTDSLRKAYVNQINVDITSESTEALAAKVDSGQLDLSLDGVPPADQVQKYSTNPQLRPFLHIFPSDAVRYISMNLAEPPFDDIHVRKAVNYIIDKDQLRVARGGPAFGAIAGHIIVDSLENNELKSFDPYATPNSRGSLTQAKNEMKQSKYDTNGDGKCDASVCKNVLTVIDEAPPYPAQTKSIAQDMAKIGITLDQKQFERTTMYTKCNTPSAHVAFCPSVAWGKDYPDAITFGPPLFSSKSIGPNACCNYSLVGASPSFLKKNRYSVTSVPSVDSQMNRCAADTGTQRISCWASVDKDLMQKVVPWVPYLFDNNVDITSQRLENYQFDQFAGLMALDQVALKGA